MNKTIATRRISTGALTACLLLGALPAAQAGTPACKGLHSSVKEAMRTMSVCITMDNPPLACNRQDMDVQRFNNDEKKLPKSRPPQEYWEGKLRDGPVAGTWRLVYLVTMGTTKNKVDARYFTNDHYNTFCKID